MPVRALPSNLTNLPLILRLLVLAAVIATLAGPLSRSSFGQPPPKPEPAPSADSPGCYPEDPPGGYPVRAFPENTNPLGRLHVARHGRLLVVSLRAYRAGVVRVTVVSGKRRIGWSRMRTPRGGNMTCRIRVSKGLGLALRRMKVTASLRAKGKLIGVRHSSVRAAHAHHHH